MQQRLTDEQWQVVLRLSEAAADLAPHARRDFLNSSGAPIEIIDQALLVIDEFSAQEEPVHRVGMYAGRFLILEYCGSGGVGDVYRAHDAELDRTVALKFLRPSALAHSGAVDRFVREARTVSSLNHPNIITVYEVLRSPDATAIVMELVEGTPLRSLCEAGLLFKQVVAISRQIALALAAAHERGIVHRDIKPENAILRPDGNVKVLDFGLAVSLSKRTEGEPVISASHLFAGTWRYMSPEQSQGESITAATDIFSLGLVICELLNGCSLDAALPDLSSIGASAAHNPGRVPRPLRPLVNAMLSTAPSQRPSAKVVSQQLAKIEQSLSGRSRHRWLAVGFSAAVLCLGAAAYFLSQREPPDPLLASAISVEPGFKEGLALSPSGDILAYAWDREREPRQLYLQTINRQTESAARPVLLTRNGLSEDLPAWSPDGNLLAFTRTSSGVHWDLVIRDMRTGHDTIVAPFVGRSLAWTKDGRWLIGAAGPYLNHSVVLISPTTGQQRPLTAATGDLDDEKPVEAEDGRNVIFARFFSDSVSRLATVPLLSKGPSLARVKLLSWPDFHPRQVRNPIYSSDGRNLFFIADVDSIRRIYRTRNGHTPVLLASLGEQVDEVSVAAHRNRMAFLRNLDDTNIWKLELPTPGGLRGPRFIRVISSLRMDQRPAVSPDGSQVAFESDRNGFPEVWLAKLSSGDTSPLTALRSQAGSPRWSPDGRWIVFDARVDNSSSIFRISALGGQPQRLTNTKTFADLLPVVSPDGRWIYFTSNRSGRFQIWRIPFAGGMPCCKSSAIAWLLMLARMGDTFTSWKGSGLPVVSGAKICLPVRLHPLPIRSSIAATSSKTNSSSLRGHYRRD